jgi:hypothetical protein
MAQEAEHSGRPLEHWDRGFEYHSRHGSLCEGATGIEEEEEEEE